MMFILNIRFYFHFIKSHLMNSNLTLPHAECDVYCGKNISYFHIESNVSCQSSASLLGQKSCLLLLDAFFWLFRNHYLHSPHL